MADYSVVGTLLAGSGVTIPTWGVKNSSRREKPTTTRPVLLAFYNSVQEPQVHPRKIVEASGNYVLGALVRSRTKG